MAYALENSRLYLVTELIDGDTLDNILFGEKREPMNIQERINISVKVSQAVAYMHNQNPIIIHRDLKAKNILVSDDVKVVKLCDMGLSKIKTMNTLVTTMAGGSAQPGTPSYQAPELLLAKQSANSASDIWALSCTLVELFSDVPIWNTPEESDKDPVEYIMEQMRLNTRPDGMEVLATVAEADICSFLGKGLSYRPDDRPNAIEFA